MTSCAPCFQYVNIYTSAANLVRDDRVVSLDGIWAPSKKIFDELGYEYRKIGTDLDGERTVVLVLNWWDTKSMAEFFRPVSIAHESQAASGTLELDSLTLVGV